MPVNNSNQITNWIWIIVGMLQSESCHLSQIANYLPMASKASSRITLLRRWLMNSHVKVWVFYKKVLEHVFAEQIGTASRQPSFWMVSCSSEIVGRSFEYRCYMVTERYLSVDGGGRQRFGEGQQVEKHVGESAAIFEKVCQGSPVFGGCRFSGSGLGSILHTIRLEIRDSDCLQHLSDFAQW